MTLTDQALHKFDEEDQCCYTEMDVREAVQEFKEMINLGRDAGDVGLKMHVRLHRWIEDIFGTLRHE